MLTITGSAIALYGARYVWGCAPSRFWDRVAVLLCVAGLSSVYIPPGSLGVPLFCGTNTIGHAYRPGVYAVSPVVATTLLPYSVPETLDRRAWPAPLVCNSADGAELKWPAVQIRWAVAFRDRAVELVNEYKVLERIRGKITQDIDTAVQRVCFQHTERTLLTTDLSLAVKAALNAELALAGIAVETVRLGGGVRPTNAEANAFYNTLPYKQSEAFNHIAGDQADRASRTVAPKFMAVVPPWGNRTV